MNNTDVIYRTAQITPTSPDQDTDGRTITMRLVAWDTPETIYDGVTESFAPGSITPFDPDQGVLLRLEHTTTIGRFTSITNQKDGAYGTAVVARTPAGDEALELARSGVITRCSVGFRPSASHRTITHGPDDTEQWTWSRAALIEASLVSFPAHPSSTITEIREDRTVPNPTTAPDSPTTTPPEAVDTTTRAAVEDLARTVGAIEARMADLTTTPSAIPFAFRSIGEYAQALASQDDAAMRAYEGATTGDAITRPEWLGVMTQVMAAKQPVLSMFTHTYDLPATGMSVEYGTHSTSTVKVNSQKKEGDALPTGKVAMTAANAPVKTYGGAGAMSYQTLQRASVDLLDYLLKEQAVKYAQQIEADTRTEFERVATLAEASPLATSTLAATTTSWWLSAIMDMVDAYDDTTHTLTGLAVSKDVFLHLASLKEERTALQISGAPTDKVGTLTISIPQADLYGLTVRRVPKWTGKHAVAYDAAAIRCKESAGAPLRLQQDNILNLSKDFAVYGYAAIFSPAESAIMALSLTA